MAGGRQGNSLLKLLMITHKGSGYKVSDDPATVEDWPFVLQKIPVAIDTNPASVALGTHPI